MFVKKKQIVWVILLTFLFGFIPCSSIKVSASDDINIISSTNITVSTAKAWAKSKGATNTFIALADLYWKYARSHGNVNPAVAYVQAAKETGYGKFGGVINETYHNPCGMKVAAGGRDDDPNAHMKFENWDKGVQAHIDHLALYAGASGYPKKGNTNDPRHFASIVRKATTVKALGTNWAPSSSYGIEILNLYRDLEKCEVVGKMIGTIDEPTGNITTDTVLVRGWALNTSGVSSIKIYIDDVLKSTVNVGDSRPDVKKVYPTYNNADKSGYSSKINISDLSNGTKTLKVEQIGKDGSKNILTRSITVNRVLSRMYIDTPTYNSTIKGNSMTVSGWAVNKEEIKAINIYVNGIKKATTTANLSRPDVKKVYPEFANASTSGFSEKISLSDIAGGKNTIKVEQVTVSNKTDSIETVVNINKPKPRTYIDAPVYGTTIKGNSLIVKGWSVSNEGIKAINIYVDGVLKKTTTANLLRPDVQKVYPEYKDASKSGFSEKIDISDISNGIKTVKVEQVSNAGKTSEQVKINVVKPRPIICIDTPVSGRSVGGSSLTVSGWAISNTAIKSINIYVAGVLKKTTTKLLSRPDVQKAYPNYLNSDKSGFSENIDISNVAAGNRVIKIEQIGKDGSKTSAQIVVKINKLPAITCIDSPTEKLKVSGNKLNVSGWAISNTAIKSINIYVDGALKKTIVANLSRPDVQKAYPQYAYSKISGYSTDIDVTNIAKGNRKLKVEQVASDGSKHSVETIFVKPDTPPRTCLDTPVSGMSVSGKYLNVSGWSINNSGVSKINIYVDGALKKTIVANLSR
ncbi:MAG: hypothetical protein E7213_02855, partial [Clostridium sp.]|nr:hypothetical protein [Clostridium sp.]